MPAPPPGRGGKRGETSHGRPLGLLKQARICGIQRHLPGLRRADLVSGTPCGRDYPPGTRGNAILRTAWGHGGKMTVTGLYPVYCFSLNMFIQFLLLYKNLIIFICLLSLSII